jgi:hypothetical protein
MKTRLSTVSAFLVSIALLALSVPGRMRFTAAQSQLASFVASAPAPDRVRVAEVLRSAPLMFVENVGQFDPAACFQVQGGAGTMWLSNDAIWITRLERATFEGSHVEHLDLDHAKVEREDELRQGVNLKLSFPGANPAPRIEPFDRLDTVVSYFISNDSDRWRPDVPVWGGVRYVDLYPGIDLELTSTAGQWQQWVIARPGADLGAVRLRVEGANTLAVDAAGNLRLTTAIGTYTLPIFQLVTADNSPIPTLGEGPMVRCNDVLFPFASLAMSSHPLSAVSPADNPNDLLYSTFLGGGDDDYGRAVAVGSSGVAYVTGTTYSSDFPTTPGVFDTTRNSSDGFVAKLNAAGSDLIYSTFLGGSHWDSGSDIVVGAAGSVYVTGLTRSSDFPTAPNAFDTTHNGGADAFAVKLNASGSDLVYSTLLGGSGEDAGDSIVVDEDGAAYIAGEAQSGYPTTAGAFDTTYNGGLRDAFVTKLNASGSGLVYSTFLGGSEGGFVYEGRDSSIAVDSNGAAYVTGYTGANDFPTTVGAFDTTLDGTADAFVTKLNLAGSDLVYSTYLGGSDYDKGYAIAVDESGAAYIAGVAESDDFPTTDGAYQTTFNGGTYDAFLTKLQADGSRLAFSTFLGGGNHDSARDIALDGDGASYVTGETESSDFPVTPDAFDTTISEPVCPSNEPCGDVFVAKLDADCTSLVYGTFLGGGADEDARDIAVDGSGTAYVTGSTDSSSFPTTPGAFDTTPKYFSDAFVARFAMGSSVPSAPVYLPCVMSGWPPIEPTGPEPGHYTGTPSVSFDVTEEQQVCNFDITIPFGEGTCQIRPNCTAIVDNEFGWEWSHDPFAFTSSITGRFDTRTHASGNYRMYVCGSQMIFTPSEGTWEASK